jgi:RNA polymerase sigma-70 factor, ECF subfamily
LIFSQVLVIHYNSCMDLGCQECRNDALQTLWKELHDRLYRFIYIRVNDPDDTEDILQNVFLKIHTNLETIRDVNKIESWVFQIARNSIMDYFRKPGKLPLDENLPVFDEYASVDTAEDLAPFIQEIIQTLPPIYQEAVQLIDYQGMNQPDAAKTLGISLSGMKSRVQRARGMIKETMLSCCHFEFDVRGAIMDYRDHCCCCENEAVTN